MVVPIIAGGAILAFITWGKDLFGAKTFNTMMKGLILLSIAVVGYIGYKMYRSWMDTKEKAEDIVEGVTESFEDVWNKLVEAGERGSETIEETKERLSWITTVTPKEFLPDIDVTIGKITPGDYETTYGPEASADATLLQKIYWAPTEVILGTKRNITEFADKLKFWD